MQIYEKLAVFLSFIYKKRASMAVFLNKNNIFA